MSDPVKLVYPDLSSTFFRGSQLGQIRSVFKARFARPGKVLDYKKAIEAGAVKIDPTKLTKPERAKLTQLAIDIPEIPPTASSDEPSDDTRVPAGELLDPVVE
jgi:hypothetical protein